MLGLSRKKQNWFGKIFKIRKINIFSELYKNKENSMDIIDELLVLDDGGVYYNGFYYM